MLLENPREKKRGVNIVGITKVLDKTILFKPLAKSLRKEYGQRISMREYMRKGQIDMVTFGVVGTSSRVMRRAIKNEMGRHK